MYDLQTQFVKDQIKPGAHFKSLSGQDGLFSVRLGKHYRGILLHGGRSAYVLIHVAPRGEVYDRLDEKLRVQANSVTGQIEVIDLEEVEAKLDEVLARTEPTAPKTDRKTQEEPGILDAYTDDELSSVGISRVLHPSLRAVKDESGLVQLAKTLDTVPAETLLGLATGKSLDEVMEEITNPARADDDVDDTDLQKAINRTPTASHKEVALMLETGSFEMWKKFLHPSQEKLVTKNYRGPARISGGPGTGKTVVLLHRAVELAKQYDRGQPILLTTFNSFLAKHLEAQLTDLAPDLAARVKVTTVDALAKRIAFDRQLTSGRPLIKNEPLEWWGQVLAENGVTELNAQFCRDEFDEVVCGNGIEDRDSYLRVRRAGRSHRLSRAQRLQFWKASQRFIARLEEENRYTYDWLSFRVANILEGDSSVSGRQFQHVLVDEAQDISASKWRLLRALVPEGDNDMFIAGDTHQRIYGAPIALGPLGINIMGRSTKLRLSYRTTKEILGHSIAMMQGDTYDDLDNGTENLAGYRSIMSGAPPLLKQVNNAEEEHSFIAEQIHSLDAGRATIAVCTAGNDRAAIIAEYLKRQGIKTTGAREAEDDAVTVSSMHGLKGLEFQHVIIAGLGAEFPRQFATRLKDSNPSEYRRQIRKEQSLLFVAATRARDTLTLLWSGEPSMFLRPLLQK